MVAPPCAASRLPPGGTTPVARQSRFHGVRWTKTLATQAPRAPGHGVG